MFSERPFHDFPGKYWDLSSANAEPLGHPQHIKVQIIIKEFHSGTMCLICPRESVTRTDPSTATADDSWYVAVDAVTSLECIRRALGPSPTDILDFLIQRAMAIGIPHTLPFSAQLSISASPTQHAGIDTHFWSTLCKPQLQRC